MGKTFSILIEAREEKTANVYQGRTYMDAPEVDGLVYVHVPKGVVLNAGEFVLARITAAQEYDLTATYLQSQNRDLKQ